MKTSLLLVLVLPFIVSGCISAAGPFVTNVYTDGAGNVVVEKNSVRFNPWTGLVSMGDTPTAVTVKMKP